MANLDEQRVVGMVEAGTITEAEGRRLIDALHPRPARAWMLINPFDQLSTGSIGILAIATTLGGLAVSQLGVHFDGTLDLHPGADPVPWPFALIEAIAAIAVTALVFWIASRIVAKRGRLVDFALSTALARIPVVAAGAALPRAVPDPDAILQQAAAGQVDTRVVLASMFVLTPSFIWFIVLLTTAFKTSSGMKGAPLAITFVLALVVAEAASKFFLFLIAPRIGDS